ncbi:MAG: glycosyltransferase [Novosphingobium sp.]|nr:glycosyltransferase [Novosphingobium sp.]
MSRVTYADGAGLAGGRRLRICLVLEAAGGGAGRHVLDLAAGLTVRGHAVELFYSPVRAERIFLDQLAALPICAVEFDMRRSIGLHDFTAAWRLKRLIAERGPFDILHAHSSKAGAVLRLAAHRSGAIVYTPHAFRALDPSTSGLRRLVLSGAESVLGMLNTDALIAVSLSELEHARQIGLAESKLHLIRNSVVNFHAAGREAARAALALPDDALVAGFIGRLSYQKAPERFVQAMSLAMARDGRIHAVLIGDGEKREEVAALAAASPHADRFHLLGAVPGVDYIRAFDVMVMTSRYEALSYVTLEAVAAGLPLITTRVAGAVDVVLDGESGLILDSDMPEAIAGAVGDVLLSPQRMASMAAAARLQNGRLNGDLMIVEVERLYQRLAGAVAPADFTASGSESR